MPYEIFAKEYPAKSTSPTLTISPLGRCTLNRASAELMNKEAVETILLLWDKDSYRFAMRPIAKKDSRSFNIRYSKKGQIRVSALALYQRATKAKKSYLLSATWVNSSILLHLACAGSSA